MTQNARKKIANIKQLTSQDIAKAAYNYFKKITPIDSGNARRRTTLTGNEINASYPYAKRLDNGYSRQAPNGMVKPTIDYIRQYINQKLGK